MSALSLPANFSGQAHVLYPDGHEWLTWVIDIDDGDSGDDGDGDYDDGNDGDSGDTGGGNDGDSDDGGDGIMTMVMMAMVMMMFPQFTRLRSSTKWRTWLCLKSQEPTTTMALDKPLSLSGLKFLHL